jgi:hypothetical protein
MTGLRRLIVRVSFDLLRAARTEAISLGSVTRAADKGTLFRKKDRSRICMDLFTGGRSAGGAFAQSMLLFARDLKQTEKLRQGRRDIDGFAAYYCHRKIETAFHETQTTMERRESKVQCRLSCLSWQPQRWRTETRRDALSSMTSTTSMFAVSSSPHTILCGSVDGFFS